MAEMDDTDLQRYRTRLQSRHQELKDLDQDHATDRDPVELDQTRVGRLSRMDALQGQAMSLATHQRRLQELKRIDLALDRLAAGDYGYCTVCDEPIAVRRLDLDPAVPICIDCAKSGETG